MASTAVTAPRSDIVDLGRLARLPLIVWCVLGVAAVALMDLRTDPGRLFASLGDADDAARMVQVRELITTGAWYDRTLPQIGAPEPLVSHWSRLVDAPLVALLFAAAKVMPAADAEIAVRALWPLLVLLAVLMAMARWAEGVAGRGAAVAAIGLAVYAQSAMLQFVPGRIDHHNVMILGASAGVLFLTRALAISNAGWPAGALLGLGTAVGYEAVVITALALSLAAVWAAWSGRGLDGVTKAAIAFAGVLAVVLLATEAPSAWARVRCDALSANLVVLAMAGAASLIAVRLAGGSSRPRRLALLATPGLAGLGLYAWIEPACLAGPFGQVDARLMPIWLAHVQEASSILRYAADNLPAAVQFAAFAAAGVAVAVGGWLRARDGESGLLLLVVTIAFALACWQIKLMPYATLLAAAPIALAIGRLEASHGVSAPAKGLLAFLAVNQHTILGAILAVTSLTASGTAATGGQQAPALAGISRCQETAAIEPLADLPVGLIAADIDLGAYIAALTPHQVLAAPYHRIDGAILEHEAIRAAPADEAAFRLRRLGVDYVVTCRGLPPGPLPARSLAALLHSGAVPDWLEQIDIEGPERIAVWRVLEARQ